MVYDVKHTSNKTIMSNRDNTIWLDAALENFEEALSEGNLKLAKEIISDVQEKGFGDEGRQLNARLRAFIAQSDKDNG